MTAHRSGSDTVVTVLGPVDVSQLIGPILPHEHILVDFGRGLLPPPRNRGLDWLTDASLSMRNLGKIRQYPYSVHENLTMNNTDEMQRELECFKSSGGGTICELSCIGMRCAPHQPEKLGYLSRQTGVNIVHATGFYCHQFLPQSVHSLSVEMMRDVMLREVCVGAADSSIRCGVIYLGCSWPLHSTEERALRAATAVQATEGVHIPIIIHPGRNEQAPFQILDILKSEGADISQICITHNERTFTNLSRLLELASNNCYINLSLFGKECSHYQYDASFDMPSDAQRIDMLKLLLQSGYRDRILVSHDVVCKHELQCYGGNGYGHLLEHVVPKMEERGISKDTINTIMTQNPRQWLTSATKLPHQYHST